MLDPSDRSGLIEIAAKGVTAPACKRAFVTGHVEVLGGFAPILPELPDGWVLSVTARHGTKFYVAVMPLDRPGKHLVGLMSEPDWSRWVGIDRQTAGYSIYTGDHPLLYEMNWRKAHDTGSQADAGGVRRAGNEGGRPRAPVLG
jgi:hypothetical protein